MRYDQFLRVRFWDNLKAGCVGFELMLVMTVLVTMMVRMMMMVVMELEESPFQWRSCPCFFRQRQHKSWMGRMMIAIHQNQ